MAFQAIFSAAHPLNGVNIALLREQAAAQFGARFVNADDGDSRGLAVYLDPLQAGDAIAWDALILAHDGSQLTAQQQLDNAYAANTADAQARWNLSAVHGKTPAQIYTAMQNEIDGWASLAAAKTSLRVWLPLMAAAIAYLAKAEKQQ